VLSLIARKPLALRPPASPRHHRWAAPSWPARNCADPQQPGADLPADGDHPSSAPAQVHRHKRGGCPITFALRLLMSVTMRWGGSPLCLAVLPLFLAGCKSDPQMDLVERELRLQEDRIYELQDYIEQYQRMLEACEHEKQALASELQEGGPSRAAIGQPSTRGGSSRTDGGAADQPGPAMLVPGGPGPDIDLGEEFAPPLEKSPSDLPDTEPADPEDLPGPGQPGSLPPDPVPDELPPPASAAGEGRVEEIVFDPQVTGMVQPGLQARGPGLSVLLLPRGADGELLLPQGGVSLMVLDPAREGPPSHVARWDFSADEAREAWRQLADREGMFFELPWPEEGPRSERLVLYGRMVMEDGRKVLAETEIVSSEPIDLTAIRAAAERRWARREHPAKLARRRSSAAPPAWDLQPIQIPGDDRSAGDFRPSRRKAASSGALGKEDSQQSESAEQAPPAQRTPPANTAQDARGPERSARVPSEQLPTWQPYR